MTVGRSSDTATLLPNGEVLIAGGIEIPTGGLGVPTELATAELYDPNSGTFAGTRSMTTERWSHTATLLGNGKVLIVGGYFGTALASAELYQ